MGFAYTNKKGDYMRLWTEEQRELLMWLLREECGEYESWMTLYYPVRRGLELFQNTVCKEFADYLSSCDSRRPVTRQAVYKQVVLTLCPLEQVPGHMMETALANRRAAQRVGFLREHFDR